MDLTYTIHPSTNPNAPVVYLIDSADHSLDLASAAETPLTLVHVGVPSWNNDLTPWPAPALQPGAPSFGGDAASTLQSLVSTVIPQAETAAGLHPRGRAIAGYSLAGLFALYAFITCTTLRFDSATSLSGSLWYDGWLPHLERSTFDGTQRFAYLSLGTKEKRAANPRMRTVEEATQQTVQLLQAKGCRVTYAPGPGNHFQHVEERVGAGIQALADFWGL